jgi:predicted esterase
LQRREGDVATLVPASTMTAAANPHLSLAPVRTGAPVRAARRVCVLVHGRNQDETVMLDVVQRLDLPDVAYVLPVAAGASWYPRRYFDSLSEHEPHLRWAIEACEAAVCAADVADERIVVGGFSQGACVLAELLARRPRPFAGAAILTGSLLGTPGQRVRPAAVDGLPMYFGSSRYDEWIALTDAQATAQAFQSAGAAVVFETYDDRVHYINDRAVAGLRTLLTRV